MASKAKKRKRSNRKSSLLKKGGVNEVFKNKENEIDFSWIKTGLLKSFFSSLLVIIAILVVYFLSQNGG